MWEEFNAGIDATISEVINIVDDAMCNGFEFKVENHRLYFREVA